MAADFKEQSRQRYGDGSQPTMEQIKLGCLQRIADATEVMAQNYSKMISDLKCQRDLADYYRIECKRLKRSNSARAGIIKKLKGKIK